MKLKPDISATYARFEAWWEGEIIDRPPVTLSVKPSFPAQKPESNHETLRDRWLDVDYQVERALTQVTGRPWLGDSIPTVRVNVGPDLTGTLWGIDLEFGENTSWAHPVINDLKEWDAVLEKEPDFNNPYWQFTEETTRCLIERSKGRYLVEIPDLHDAFDMMVNLRGPENLCLDLMDDPGRIVRVAQRGADIFCQALQRAWEPLEAAGMGATTWIPFYHPTLAYVPSCDFWCLVSHEMARDVVLSVIEKEMAVLDRSIFHLDGPDALRHLDLLLDLPPLYAIQWVYGAGNGPASKWIPVYKRCLEKGKSIQVLAETAEDGLEVLRKVGVRGVWICIDQPFHDISTAETLLEEVANITLR